MKKKETKKKENKTKEQNFLNIIFSRSVRKVLHIIFTLFDSLQVVWLRSINFIGLASFSPNGDLIYIS